MAVSAEDLIGSILANNRKPSKKFWRTISGRAAKLKATAVSDNDKNRLWSVQTFADATEYYLEAYRQIARGLYYDGWCTLEQAEIGFDRLVENKFVARLVPIIRQRADLIALWQSTFPYRHFVSPGMIYKKWACSICGKQSTPVNPCGHIPNRVYAGTLCYRIIQEAQPIEVSIVTDPVQKYSVLQLEYDYSVVRYVLDHLTGPFHKWTGEWSHKRHPHSKFTDRLGNGPCPCNSNLRYEECCLLENGVRLPHFQMTVSGGAARAGTLKEKLVLHPPDESTNSNGDMTVRANLLKIDT